MKSLLHDLFSSINFAGADCSSLFRVVNLKSNEALLVPACLMNVGSL